jgi:Kdo2-lipid IVA lauroyltransferase/acyltransferase
VKRGGRKRGPIRRLRRATRGPRNALLAAGIRRTNQLFALLPLAAALAIGRAFGWLYYALIPSVRRLADHHLALAFPDWTPARRRQVIRGMFLHAGASVVELAQWPTLRGTGYVTVDGSEVMDAALTEGRGVIAITGHIGNWELLAAEMARRGYPVTVVARRVKEPRFQALVGELRRETGLVVLDRDSPTFTQDVRAELDKNRIVALLIDQDTRGAGVWVPFFGRPARTPPGAAVLALRKQAPVIAIFIERRPEGGHRITIRAIEPSEGRSRDRIVALTARMTAAIEAQIRHNPVEWVWWHERWRHQAADGSRS